MAILARDVLDDVVGGGAERVFRRAGLSRPRRRLRGPHARRPRWNRRPAREAGRAARCSAKARIRPSSSSRGPAARSSGLAFGVSSWSRLAGRRRRPRAAARRAGARAGAADSHSSPLPGTPGEGPEAAGAGWCLRRAGRAQGGQGARRPPGFGLMIVRSERPNGSEGEPGSLIACPPARPRAPFRDRASHRKNACRSNSPC
jgi:hypothetical protein